MRTDDPSPSAGRAAAQADEKSTLRRRLLTTRAALAAPSRSEASAAVCARLARLPELAGVRAVLGYAAFGHEVDVDAWLRGCLAAGLAVHLPWVDGDRLGVARVEDLDADLGPGWRGVREPPPERRRAVRPARIDLAVVPGVGFDRSGGRLGYGGGHFDRFLGRLRPGVPVVGVAFAAQVVAQVPREPHDRRVDVLVTDTGVVRPG